MNFSVICGLIAFHSTRAVIFSTVSNVCGFSSGPGTLWTFVPMSTTVSSGAPGVSSIVNARKVLAATPGRSS